MTTLTIPNTLSNGITVDGVKLQQNFAAVSTHVNNELLNKDGSVAMTAPLTVVTPVAGTDAATKAYVDAARFIGEVTMYGGSTVPDATWMFCRGQAISRTTYATLFGRFGTAFGSGDGSTTFNLPNYQGTVPVGFNSGTNAPSGLSGKFTGGVGERVGSTDAVVVSHAHTGVDHLHSVNINTGGESAQHYHTSNSLAGFVGSSLGGNQSGTTGGGYFLETQNTTNWNASGHFHNVSGNTGAADRDLTTGVSGTSGTNANIQPSQTINFMVKVL